MKENHRCPADRQNCLPPTPPPQRSMLASLRADDYCLRGVVRGGLRAAVLAPRGEPALERSTTPMTAARNAATSAPGPSPPSPPKPMRPSWKETHGPRRRLFVVSPSKEV